MMAVRCPQSDRDDDFQRYLGRGMADGQQEAFEEHYFECGDCYEALENHRAIRAVVSRDRMSPAARFTPRIPLRVLWAGVAAAVLLAISVSLLRRVTPGEPPPASQVVASAGERASAALPSTMLDELARFDPPPYRAVTSRAVETPAGRAFRAGMASYQAGAFADAARQLRAAGDGAQVEETRFFLGISELQLGEVDAGIANLRAVVALGDTAYFEEAAYFLAKALLGRRDVDGARQLLERLVSLRADRAADAGRLLEGIRRLPSP